MWAIDAHNCRAVAELVPHMQLFGSWLDLTPLAPLYLFVVALNNYNTSGRFNSRPLLSRYTGPARLHDIGAIRVQDDRSARVVRTWRFIATTDTEADPATLRVAPEIETRGIRPAPAREEIYDTARRTGGAAGSSDNPDDDEARRSWYISRPWTISEEFQPRNVSWSQPHWHHPPPSDTKTDKSQYKTAAEEALTSTYLPGTSTARYSRSFGSRIRSGFTMGGGLVAVVVGPGTGTLKTSPSSSDGGALAIELQSLHGASHGMTAPPLGAMSLHTVLRRPDAMKWVAAFDKERLDLASTFTGGKPTLSRVHRSEVAAGFIVLKLLFTNYVNRVDKQRLRWVVDRSRRPGEEHDISASSVLLVFSATAKNKWDVAQFGAAKAYMLTVPSHMYHVRYPPGFEEYLVRSGDTKQFNTNAFYCELTRTATE